MADVLTGVEFKKELREGKLKLDLFLNSHSLRWRSSWRTAGTTGCWWIRSTDQWVMRKYRLC